LVALPNPVGKKHEDGGDHAGAGGGSQWKGDHQGRRGSLRKGAQVVSSLEYPAFALSLFFVSNIGYGVFGLD
jgi:hypothetical protein